MKRAGCETHPSRMDTYIWEETNRMQSVATGRMYIRQQPERMACTGDAHWKLTVKDMKARLECR